MTVWLGKPGALVALPDPAPGVSATLTRVHGVHTTLGGGRVVDFAGPGRRAFTLRWERLADDEYAVLEALHTGVHGPGPFVFLPADTAWNYLTANQAAGGDVTGTPVGFAISGVAETLTVAPTGGLVGPRCLAWSLPATPTRANLDLLASSGLPGFPVPEGAIVTFSTQARAPIPVVFGWSLRWLDATGTQVGAISNSPGAPLSSGYARHLHTAAAPPGAAYAHPVTYIRQDSITAATTVHLDGFALELAAAAGVWRPGRGVPLVSVTELTDLYPWADVHDTDMTLTEVGLT